MNKLRYIKLIAITLVCVSCQKKTAIKPVKGLENVESIISQEILPEIHFYGETLPVHLVISDSIAKQFGFILKRVGGDVISQEMMIKTKNNNQKTLEFLNKKYGGNWRENFEKETGKKIKYYLILK